MGGGPADDTLGLCWCTEKPHSMVHWSSTYETVGRCCTISANVTESRMKTAVKTKARKTNNQASFSGSILKANMEVEAAVELAQDLDATGMHSVRLHRVGFLGFCQVYSSGLETLCRLCTPWRKCTSSLHTRFWRMCRLLQSLHSLLDADLFLKKCAPSLRKVCKVCTCSAPSLQANYGLFWEQPVVG